MQVQILPSDYIAAIRLKMRPSPAFAVIGLIIVALALVALFVVLMVGADGADYFGAILILVAAGYLAAWYWLLLPWQIKRLYKQQRSLHDPFTLDIEASGIRSKNQFGEGLTPWNHIYRWKESSSLYVLFQSDALMHIIPKRAFSSPDEANAFGLTLGRQVGPANKALKQRRAEGPRAA